MQSRLRFALIVGVCAVGQLSTLLHRALVQHVTCVEHGESVHVRGRDNSGASSSAASGASAARRHVVLAAAVMVSADAHDHCSLGGSRAAPSQNLGGQALAAPALDTHRCGFSDARPAWSVARYLIAPKTSPPVTAES